MADSKTSQLPAAGAVTGAELLHLVQGGNSRQASLDLVKAFVKAGLVASDIGDFPAAVKSYLTPGSGMSLAYNSTTGVTTISCAINNEYIDDRVAALLQAGDNISLTYNDVSNTLTIASTATASLPSGTIINSKYAEYTANADLATPIPWDDTLPQGTEGTQILSITHTAASATNKIRIRFNAWGTANAPTSVAMIATLVRDSSASASAATMATAEAAGNLRALCLEYELTAGDTVAHTYNIRVGAGSGTMRLNGSASSRWLGGAARATLVLEEIKA